MGVSGRKKSLTKRIIIFSSLLSILIGMDLRLRPLIKTVASNRAQIISTKAINEAVLEELNRNSEDYTKLVHIERSNEGQVLAVSTDIKRVNLLKSRVSIAIQEKLSGIEVKQAGIPLGTLIGGELFNGRGPIIPMKISVSGSVFTEFTSNFSEAGINQTRHQIYLNIHTRISAFVPGYPSSTDVYTNMSVSETIIVGSVPRVYANGSQYRHINGIEDLSQSEK